MLHRAGSVIENSVIGLPHHRPERGHPQFDPHGKRLLRIAGRRSGSNNHGRPGLGIGSGSRIEGAIVDKNCRIGRNVRIVNSQGVEQSEETPHGMICDGVVVIPKDNVIPDNVSFPPG